VEIEELLRELPSKRKIYRWNS